MMPTSHVLTRGQEARLARGQAEWPSLGWDWIWSRRLSFWVDALVIFEEESGEP